MLRLRGRLYLEPGEMELLAVAAGQEGQRLHRARGSSLPRAVRLDQMSFELSEMMADPHPLYVIGAATKRQARMMARRFADGVRELAGVYRLANSPGRTPPAAS